MTLITERFICSCGRHLERSYTEKRPKILCVCGDNYRKREYICEDCDQIFKRTVLKHDSPKYKKCPKCGGRSLVSSRGGFPRFWDKGKLRRMVDEQAESIQKYGMDHFTKGLNKKYLSSDNATKEEIFGSEPMPEALAS